MKLNIPTPVALASLVLLLTAFILAFAWGVAAVRLKIFPHDLLQEYEEALQFTLDTAVGNEPWYYQPTQRTQIVYSTDDAPAKGLNLVTAMGPKPALSLKVVDMQGIAVHEWTVDWFDIWPNTDHLPAEAIPQIRPGAHLHGTWLLPDGDVLFNFENLGLVRMGVCGDVKWKLPYQTHHSVHIDDDGNIWVPGLSWKTEPMPDYPANATPIHEQTVIKVSQQGELLDEISVFDVLAENDQRALLHMRSSALSNTIWGDNLHLNDVEIFPDHMKEGVFRHGDIVISLRNISTVIVFDPVTLKIRYMKVGGFVRQHDPDFVDGNTLLIFDNNFIGPAEFGQQSRILSLDARTDKLSVIYTGNKTAPFYTHLMGKQQLLDNGHLVITDSMSGRGFEVDSEGRIIWEYVNITEAGTVGIIEEIERIPESFRNIFNNAQCSGASIP